jgi:hypothetical protein
MIRRRRPEREIPFSFDSFLDIVANVVGIIIRLILVVWVGARSYHTLQHMHESAPETPAAEARALTDPLQTEIAQRQHDLEEAQRQLLDQLRQFDLTRGSQQQVQRELATIVARRQSLEQRKTALGQEADQQVHAARASALTLQELRRRSQGLAEEIQALQKLPPVQKTLRYRTPVSRPVQCEELLFECRYGRVTFIDINALLTDVRRDMEDKGQLLKTQWLIAGSAGPVGAFRLRYTIERERGALDTLRGGIPDSNSGYRYGLSSWELEPVALVRGEPVQTALAEGSEFRHIIESLDGQQTVVTLWVYPDSFELYRQLRDYLYDRDVVVAGRPLPEGMPVASSRRGTVSRGQ